MPIEHVIGRIIKGRVEDRKQRRIEEQLESAGLSQDDIEAVEPYIDYVVENGGGVGKIAIFALFTVVGLGLVVFGLVAGFRTVLMLLFIGMGLFFLGFPAVYYRRFKRARNLKDALLSNPEQFVDGRDHGYASIADD